MRTSLVAEGHVNWFK